MHYRRARLNGGPLVTRPLGPKPGSISRPLADRFWEKVNVGAADECWLWQASTTPAGYGKLGSGGKRGRTLIAAHVAVQLSGRSIPLGMEVDHLCFNVLCVNPGHLEVVTPGENKRRAEAHYRHRDPVTGRFLPV
jgi:hypothetical protein